MHVKRRVTGFEVAGARVVGVRLDEGEPLPVGRCGGRGWRLVARNWLVSSENPVPLETQRGYHVTVRSSNLTLRHTVMATEDNMMVNPMSMGFAARRHGRVRRSVGAAESHAFPTHCSRKAAPCFRTWTRPRSRPGWVTGRAFPTACP